MEVVLLVGRFPDLFPKKAVEIAVPVYLEVRVAPVDLDLSCRTAKRAILFELPSSVKLSRPGDQTCLE